MHERKQTYRRNGGVETRLSILCVLCLVQLTNGVAVNRINFVNKKQINKKLPSLHCKYNNCEMRLR